MQRTRGSGAIAGLCGRTYIRTYVGPRGRGVVKILPYMVIVCKRAMQGASNVLSNISPFTLASYSGLESE